MDGIHDDTSVGDSQHGRVDEMFAAARAVQQNAHAPYSNYRVGAALLTPSGRIFVGCNVENAAYPQGACAEAGAIAAMVAAGEREIVAVLTVCDGEQLGTCCGGCRQRIREFAKLSIPVYAADATGVRATFTLDELLPHSFGPAHLG
ncbi:MAG: cdd [Acidimicrobiales bacterium]|jgi:cytidine deaminase|nr:cdd [Acidimicrobiales bacterium]